MNSIIEQYYPLFEYYQALRRQLMEILTDGDLAFTPGGENLTLGELCREIGETQQAYIDSFKTFKFNEHVEPKGEKYAQDLGRITAWFHELDAELRQVIEQLSEETIQNQLVEREENFKIPIRHQLEIYKEALIIFYGKVSIYLKLMGKERSRQWQAWIA